MLYSNECNCYTYNFILWRFYNPEWTATGNSIAWYVVPTGGTPLGTSSSAANFIIVPSGTTTYWAEGFIGSSGSQTFSYTGSAQTFTVPSSVASITVDVAGTEGMLNLGSGSTPGYGGRVQCTIPVTSSQVLQVNVGGGGIVSNSGGFNGGAAGGASNITASEGGGGGGASDIRQSPYALSNILVVAGGGGGAGGDRNSGGSPGRWRWWRRILWWWWWWILRWKRRRRWHSNFRWCRRNTRWIRNCRLIWNLGSGGIGGLINSTGQAGTNYGAVGGAGGGLTGTAGANGIYTVNWIGGGGGGGSSFTYSGATGVIHTQGYQTGNGQVIITWNGFVCASSSRTSVTVQVTGLLPPTNVTAPPQQ